MTDIAVESLRRALLLGVSIGFVIGWPVGFFVGVVLI